MPINRAYGAFYCGIVSVISVSEIVIWASGVVAGARLKNTIVIINNAMLKITTDVLYFSGMFLMNFFVPT